MDYTRNLSEAMEALLEKQSQGLQQQNLRFVEQLNQQNLRMVEQLDRMHQRMLTRMLELLREGVDEEEEVSRDDCCSEHHPSVDALQVFDESPKRNTQIKSDEWFGEGHSWQFSDQIVNEDSNNNHEVEQFMLHVDSCSHELGCPVDQRINAGQSEPPVHSETHYGSNVKSEPIEDDCRRGHGLGLSLGANSSEVEKPNIVLRGDESPLDTSNRNFPTAESLEDVKADIAPTLGEKRKRTDYSFLTNDEDSQDYIRLKGGSSARIKDQAEGSARENMSVKEASTVDIMGIVREPEHTAPNRVMRQTEEVYKLNPIYTEDCGWKWVKSLSFMTFDPGGMSFLPKCLLPDVHTIHKLVAVSVVFDPGKSISPLYGGVRIIMVGQSVPRAKFLVLWYAWLVEPSSFLGYELAPSARRIAVQSQQGGASMVRKILEQQMTLSRQVAEQQHQLHPQISAQNEKIEQQHQAFNQMMHQVQKIGIKQGVGSTIGAGVYIFVGTVARKHFGPSLAFSFLIAGVAAGLSPFCYAELASRCPSTGSAYHYSYICVGESVAWLIGWALILEYTVGGSAVARGISPILSLLFGGENSLPSFRALCKGIKESTFAQRYSPYGANGMLAESATVFFAYVNFDSVARLQRR